MDNPNLPESVSNKTGNTAFEVSGPVTEDVAGNNVVTVPTIETHPNEAPASSASQPAEDEESIPEEVLRVENIQGNILTGFNKDHQTLLFLKIPKGQEANFRRWLGSLVPNIATVDEVWSFNRVWKKLHFRRGENRAIQATWVNIAFSFNALHRLTSSAGEFKDQAFKEGLQTHSKSLGDPTSPNSEGCPKNWLIGGPGNEADVVLIIASDDEDNLAEEVSRIEATIYEPRDENGNPLQSGVQIIFKQQGATLPTPLTGHEHFGFRDGISQPGIRGLVGKHGGFLTKRQNALNSDQGKPGQDLLWPGEFVFGYKGQDPKKDIKEPSDSPVNAGPAWADDGSFLVFRRLRQDVAGFHAFLRNVAAAHNLSPELFGAKTVGRWESGAPILRAAQTDNLVLAADDCANNHFEYQSISAPINIRNDGDDCLDDTIPQSQGDPKGLICPVAGHIRKAYPRDDTEGFLPGGESDVQTHRLLRRGIPFGEPLNEKPDSPQHDSGNRGLLFLAYMTSITNQFEFVTKFWVNNPDFRSNGVGFDPILGQNGHNSNRTRNFTFDPHGDGNAVNIELTTEWVLPTGGGYFFAPSISTLERIAGGLI